MFATKASMLGTMPPLPTVDSGAIAFESAGPGAVTSYSTTTTYSHTIGSSVTALVAVVYSTSAWPVTASVGGKAMTLLTNAVGVPYFGATQYLLLFGLLNPPTGTQTVSLGIPAAYATTLGGNTLAYTGVTGFAATGAVTTAAATSVSIGIPTVPNSVAIMSSTQPGKTLITSGVSSYSGTLRTSSSSVFAQESSSGSGNTISFTSTYSASAQINACVVNLK